MLKLIKLEWKRNNISRLIRNAVIMTAVLLVFIMITAGEAGADVTTRGFFNKSFIHASVSYSPICRTWYLRGLCWLALL